MAQILGIRIQRYKALADVTLGKLGPKSEGAELPSLVCLIGPNGSGKSTLLDAFGFLADCLSEGVEAACDKKQRGGFLNLRTQGETGPIEFELYYQTSPGDRPIVYRLAVDEQDGVPVAVEEELRQARKGKERGKLFAFAKVRGGVATIWKGESTPTQEGEKRIKDKLADRDRLAIATYGQLKEHPRIVSLRRFIEGWYLSYFTPEAARTIPPQGAQPHLNRLGDNLANVVQYMQERHGDRFARILEEISLRIPGIRSITHKKSDDGRVLLQFNEAGYVDPFYAPSMSDGTLKMFAYLLLLEDPKPHPFVGIEEPENGLYHRLVERLATEFKAYAAERPITLLVTTHSPYFVDALAPDQVWLVQRDERGRATVTRAADMPTIRELVGEGIPLGSLWYSNHLEERVPL
jgi:predicted ATPase